MKAFTTKTVFLALQFVKTIPYGIQQFPTRIIRAKQYFKTVRYEDISSK